ncbi:hypothetical protein [Streptomyces phage phiScoe45]|nr:hypothetical protein [Streptomyces phage phiScoe45]
MRQAARSCRLGGSLLSSHKGKYKYVFALWGRQAHTQQVRTSSS